MGFLRVYVLVLLSGSSLIHSVHAMPRVENLSDYHFGIVRPGDFPAKETSLLISMINYTVTISGRNDQNPYFNLANGVHRVPYSIFWKDYLGNPVHLLPNTVSPVFRGVANNTITNATQLASLMMKIQGYAPRPGHYSDTLTLLINPL